jgi:prepilin-type processing-associated H-X9-DG protein
MFELAFKDEQASNHPGLINVAYGDGSTHALEVSMSRAELMKLFLVADEAIENELPEN